MNITASTMRMWSRLGPSGALGAAATELGDTNDKVLFVSADMTFAGGLERFKAKYPDRHFEVGIAEQDLIGVSAGLASEGFIPYAVTYATFLATRASDQVKMCLGYMKQNVKMVGLNGGLATGILGPTHMALEDIAVMRTIPNITILSPADTTETVKAVLAAAEIEGPVFIRLTGDMNQPLVYKEDYEFEVGKAVSLRDGADVSIVATGAVVSSCLKAAEDLESKGINCGVINMHTIKPIDTEMLASIAGIKLVVTVEEHSIIGGLGSAVAEYYSEMKNAPVLKRIGINDRYPHAGSYTGLLAGNGLDPDGIADQIEEAFRKAPK